jgi:hypothetical protein
MCITTPLFGMGTALAPSSSNEDTRTRFGRMEFAPVQSAWTSPLWSLHYDLANILGSLG